MPKNKKNAAVFITGTDTSVGKTYVSALLLDYLLGHGIDVSYQKWVSTGDDQRAEDLDHCLATSRLPYEDAEIASHVPYRFKLPASPHLAAEQEGREVDPNRIITSYQHLRAAHDLLIVEGVGGLHVPLTRKLLLADLLAKLAIPTLIVARTGLGTINHTLLTIEALRSRNLSILGVIFSDSSEDENELLAADNRQTIAQMADVEIFGRLQWCEDIDQAKEQFAQIGAEILPQLTP